MQYILSLLPVLACPIGMGLLMWFMLRRNKQESPGEADRARLHAYHQPLAAVEVPTMAEPPKRASTFNLLGMCLNWKVLAGLAVVGAGILVLAPQFFWAALPILLVAACPLSMLFMMRGISGGGGPTARIRGDRFPAAGLQRDEGLAELQSGLPGIKAEQEAIARQIAEMESPEVPVASAAEAVARVSDERSRKHAANRQK